MPRVMEISTPLGDDVLLFHGMHAHEELSRLSTFQVDLLSPKNDINPDDILGKNVTVKLALPEDKTRYFNGFVTRFSSGEQHGRYTRYFAVVHSWLWFLTRTADCRIFQEMSVPDIVKKVFADHGMADFKLQLTGTYRKWTYCVQYRETDFNFISRLLEHEGIYYYVQHTDGHNTVVLSDSTAKHTATPGYETIPYVSPEQVVKPELEHISSWDFTREIQPGVYVHDDYDLERPSVELRTKKVLSRSYEPSDYEVYDYPGIYMLKADGEATASVRIDEFGSQFETSQAVTNAKGISVGSLFTLDAFSRADQNREHLIVAADYNLIFSEYEAMPDGGGTEYRCSFVAMSSEQQFRPKRTTPKPSVQGPQTAVVVGPAGDEIYTDKYGRVKVQFHWDRVREEGSEQLVLDPRVAPVGRQGVGRGVDAAHRAGGHRRFPGRRPRSADHHRPRVQRRQPAPVRVPGWRGVERHQVADAQGRRVQRAVDGRHGREGTRVHPRPVQHGHRHRERPDLHDSQESDGQGRYRRLRDRGWQSETPRGQEPDHQHRRQSQ